jgi:hypothetical protein
LGRREVQPCMVTAATSTEGWANNRSITANGWNQLALKAFVGVEGAAF